MQVRLMKRWLSAMLALTMAIVLVAPATALAADEEVTNVQLAGYADGDTVKINTDDDPVQLTLLAIMKGTAADKDVSDVATWVSQNSSVVKVEKGRLTGLKASSDPIKITGSYKGYNRYVYVTVANLYGSLELQGVPGTVEISLGTEDVALNAVLNKVEGGTENVTNLATWSTSNADVVTVDKGKLKFKSEGTAKITVKYKSLSDSVEYKVKSPYSKLEYYTLANDSAKVTGPIEMQVGEETDDENSLGVEATLLSGSPEIVTNDVTWKSSNEAAVTVDKGKLKAVGLGSSKITVSYLGKSAEITVLVRLPYLAMKLDPERKEVIYFMNDAASAHPNQFKVNVMKNPTTSDDVTDKVTWTSSDPVVATVSIVKEAATGDNVAQINAKSYGSTKITASYLGLSKDIQVEVYKPLIDLTVEKDSVQLFKKESASLPKVTGKLLDGDTVDFTSKLVWSSTDEEIVKVEGGKLVAGVPGTATVSATLNNRTVEFEVQVQEKVLALISKEDTFSLIVGGKSVNLPEVKAVFEDGTMVDNVSDKIEWKTTSSNLLIKNGTIMGLMSGRASLTGTYLNKTITIPVVMEDEIVKVTVEPSSIDLNFKRSKSIKVTGTYANGKTTTLSTKLNWSSSDESVATVKGSTVKALEKIGSATLTATYQEKSITVTVKVTPKLTKLQADETRLTLGVGKSGKTNIVAMFEDNTYKIVNAEAAWTSSKPTFVTVDSSGNIKAIKKGTASIKANYNGKTVTISVTVK